MQRTQLIKISLVNTAINTVGSDKKPVTKDGWINLATVLPVTNGKNAVVFAQVELLREGDQVGVLWGAHASARGKPASLPCVQVFEGDEVRLRAAVLAANLTISARVEVYDEPIPVSEVYVEKPGDGPGDFTSIDLGDPGAGVDWAQQTVAAQTIEVVKTYGGTVAMGSQRNFALEYSDGTNVVGGAVSGLIPVGTSPIEGAGEGNVLSGAGAAGNAVPAQCPRIVLYAGDKWQPRMPGIAAGDNLGQGRARVERWATL